MVGSVQTDFKSVGPLALAVGNQAQPTCTCELADIDASCGFRPDSVRIFIIDDEEMNIDLLQIYLGDAGYENCSSTTDATKAVDLIREQQPDLILSDLRMPKVDGFEILNQLRQDKTLRLVPVIILTAVSSAESKLRALELGVNDLLSKPVDPSELLLRIRNALVIKALQDNLAGQSARLEREVKARTAELEASRQEAMHCLARAAEFRDDDTGKHVIRVGRYVALIANELGFSQRRIAMLEQAAQLHDVGKIGIPDAVLLKPGKLDPGEFAMIKQHCKFGTKIIQPMNDEEWRALQCHTQVGAKIFGTPSSPIMKLAARIAETHHERWDGSGYPRGLSGKDIPIEGRITAVADVFDALSSERPYKQAFPIDKCVAILEEGRATHFDTKVLDAFFACFESVLKVREEFADQQQPDTELLVHSI